MTNRTQRSTWDIGMLLTKIPEKKEGITDHLPTSITEKILLLEDLPSGVLLASNNGTILWMNPHLLALLKAHFGRDRLPASLAQLFKDSPTQGGNFPHFLSAIEIPEWITRLSGKTS